MLNSGSNRDDVIERERTLVARAHAVISSRGRRVRGFDLSVGEGHYAKPRSCPWHEMLPRNEVE